MDSEGTLKLLLNAAARRPISPRSWPVVVPPCGSQSACIGERTIPAAATLVRYLSRERLVNGFFLCIDVFALTAVSLRVFLPRFRGVRGRQSSLPWCFRRPFRGR